MCAVWSAFHPWFSMRMKTYLTDSWTDIHETWKAKRLELSRLSILFDSLRAIVWLRKSGIGNFQISFPGWPTIFSMRLCESDSKHLDSDNVDIRIPPHKKRNMDLSLLTHDSPREKKTPSNNPAR